MALRKLKPTSAGRRFQTVSDFAEITAKRPEKSLVKGLSKKAGRNNNGRITVRRRGGGQKRLYRIIDFKRDKMGVNATVSSIDGQKGLQRSRNLICALLRSATPGTLGQPMMERPPRARGPNSMRP